MTKATEGDKTVQATAHLEAHPRPTAPEALPSAQLMAETAREAITLVKSQIELAKAELKQDLQSEVKAAKGLSVAAVCGLMVLNMLLVAAAFALVTVMPVWTAALVIAGVVALVGGVAGLIGWKHAKMPLARTRKSLEEDVRWVKERTA